MPEEVTDVKTPDGAPEPSTGTTLTPPADAEGYSKWRLTGEIPKKPPQQESSAHPAKGETSDDKSDDKPLDEPEENIASGAGPGKSKQEYRNADHRRLIEVLDTIKAAGFSGPSELKTFRREAQAPPVQPPAQQTSVNPSPPPPKLTEPKLEDFKTWEEFRTAERAYNDQRIEARVLDLVMQQQNQQQAAAKFNEARQRYGDEGAKTVQATAGVFFNDQAIHPAIKGLLNESPVLADLLYIMGSDQGELNQFIQVARTNPGEALRRAVVLEQYVKDELSKSSNGAASKEPTGPAPHELLDRDERGRFLAKEAPPPAREVSGRASPPPNEADAAFHSGNVRAYINAKNREQLAARRGR